MEKEFIVETRPTGRERELTEGRTSEVNRYQCIFVVFCTFYLEQIPKLCHCNAYHINLQHTNFW